jgi:hypothetical protein
MHAEHTIETDWSPVNTQAIRATCRECGAWQEAWCLTTTYATIRHAQQQARAWLVETCCIPQHQATRQAS